MFDQRVAYGAMSWQYGKRLQPRRNRTRLIKHKGEFEEGNFEAFDELRHEIEVEGIDRVARKVIVRIAEKKGVSVTINAGNPASQKEA